MNRKLYISVISSISSRRIHSTNRGLENSNNKQKTNDGKGVQKKLRERTIHVIYALKIGMNASLLEAFRTIPIQ